MIKIFKQNKISSYLKNKRVKVILIFLILNALIVSKTFLTYKNTLNRNGNWQSTKTSLRKGVISAHEFMDSTISLYKEKLNLGAWNGFQEVIYVKKLKPKSVSFDFYLEEESYLYFIFNKTNSGFSGIRISDNDSLPSQYIEANHSGRFIRAVPISSSIFKANNWQSGQINFKQDSLNLIVDNQSVEIPLTKEVQSAKLGFRGSFRNSYIDNVVVVDESSQIILKENFSGSKRAGLILLISILGLVILNGLLGLSWQHSGTKQKLIFNRIIILNIVTFLCVTQVLIFIYFYLNKNYPTLNSFLLSNFKKVEEIESNWLEEERRSVNQEIAEKARYSLAEDNATRVIFIGSSQTWGAGASTIANDFISLAQEKVSRNYELINAGISGTQSSELLALYKSDWIYLEPDIVIINLSVNDFDYNPSSPDVFEKNLINFVELNKEKNIQTVFLLEAASPEKHPDRLDLHPTMIKIAKNHNVPYFDLHTYLSDRNNSGIIWWDFVHLTDYGHELAAEFIVNDVLPNLQISSELN